MKRLGVLGANFLKRGLSTYASSLPLTQGVLPLYNSHLHMPTNTKSKVRSRVRLAPRACSCVQLPSAHASEFGIQSEMVDQSSCAAKVANWPDTNERERPTAEREKREAVGPLSKEITIEVSP